MIRLVRQRGAILISLMMFAGCTPGKAQDAGAYSAEAASYHSAEAVAQSELSQLHQQLSAAQIRIEDLNNLNASYERQISLLEKQVADLKKSSGGK